LLKLDLIHKMLFTLTTEHCHTIMENWKGVQCIGFLRDNNRWEHVPYDCHGRYGGSRERPGVHRHWIANPHPSRTWNTRPHHQRDRRTHRWARAGQCQEVGVACWSDLFRAGWIFA